MIVPMSFSIVYDLTGSNEASLVAASYLLFGIWYYNSHYTLHYSLHNQLSQTDVGMLTLNQYILLDPILLCFMTASVLGMVKVTKATRAGNAFKTRWWCWLLFTGAMLSCTISVKFVGLFVLLLVGLHTINDLWVELGVLSRPVASVYRINYTDRHRRSFNINTCTFWHRFTLWNNCSPGLLHWFCGPFVCMWYFSTSTWPFWITAEVVTDFIVQPFSHVSSAIHCTMPVCHERWHMVLLLRWKIIKPVAAIYIHIIICIRKELAPNSNRYVYRRYGLVAFVVQTNEKGHSLGRTCAIFV